MDEILELTDEQKSILAMFSDQGVSFEELVQRSGFCEYQIDKILDDLIKMQLVREVE